MAETTAETASDAVQRDAEGCELIFGTTTLRVNGIGVTLKAPETQPIGDLLLLPPWDEIDEAWCLRSRVCAKALKKGYRLVLPSMGKSIYCHEVYAETREDWRAEPTFGFLKDTLLPVLQERFCLLSPEGNNFVLGVGSGARGVVRLLEELPSLFAAGAALSGDYDPTLAPKDNLYRGFLGEMEAHDLRWKETENLCLLADRIKTPLLLAHGQADDYVPATQTEFLYNVLREKNPSLNVQFSLSPDKGHGFSYWNSELSDIFHFFETAAAAHAEAP